MCTETGNSKTGRKKKDKHIVTLHTMKRGQRIQVKIGNKQKDSQFHTGTHTKVEWGKTKIFWEHQPRKGLLSRRLSATILHQPFSPPLGLKFAAAFKTVLLNITTFSTANLTQSQAPAMYSYRQGDNEQKIKPFFLPYIAFTILFPLLFAALVSRLTNPKRLLPTNGNGKKRGEQRQSGTPDRRKNWKLKAAASRSGPGNTLEVESRKTRVHTLHPQAARLAARERPNVCARPHPASSHKALKSENPNVDPRSFYFLSVGLWATDLASSGTSPSVKWEEFVSIPWDGKILLT